MRVPLLQEARCRGHIRCECEVLHCTWCEFVITVSRKKNTQINGIRIAAKVLNFGVSEYHITLYRIDNKITFKSHSYSSSV